MNNNKTIHPADARELTAKELKDVVGGGVKPIPGMKKIRRAKTIPGHPRRMPGT